MRFGLKDTTIDKINTIFVQYPAIEQVILYGSRAKGSYRNGSDIDLTIKGKALTFTELMKIESQLDDLNLPYQIDISQFDKINNLDLRMHIDRVGKLFYLKSTLIETIA